MWCADVHDRVIDISDRGAAPGIRIEQVPGSFSNIHF